MSEVVLTEVDGGVMTITLNRPEAKNAVNLAMAQGCLLYTSPSPRDATLSRMPSSA